jgi:hypothetical protein
MRRRLIDMRPDRLHRLTWFTLYAPYLVMLFATGVLDGAPWWVGLVIGAGVGYALLGVADRVARWQAEQRRTELYRSEVERREAKLRDEGKL